MNSPLPFSRNVWLLLLALLVAGCSSRTGESTDTARSADDSIHEDSAQLPVESPPEPSGVSSVPRLSREQVEEIREVIHRSGGTLQCDDQGQPVEIDFLANRASIDQAAWQAVIRCATLSRLRIRAGEIAPRDLARLGQLEHLQLLHLEDAQVSDAIVRQWMPAFSRMQHLSLRNTPRLTDEGVAELAQLPQLRSLALIGLSIQGAALRSLVSSPRLTALDLRMCHRIQVADLAVLAAMERLVDLKLGGYSVTDEQLATVAELPRLQSLTIEDAAISRDGLRRLAEGRTVGSMQQLAFTRCAALTDEACESLAPFPELRGLLLRDVPVTGTFLRRLPGRVQWERLSLSQTYVTAEGLEGLGDCQQLRDLDLSRTFLNREIIQTLRDLPRLERLDLSDCGLTDEMVEPLASLPRIKTLNVAGNPALSPSVVKQLVEP